MQEPLIVSPTPSRWSWSSSGSDESSHASTSSVSPDPGQWERANQGLIAHTLSRDSTMPGAMSPRNVVCSVTVENSRLSALLGVEVELADGAQNLLSKDVLNVLFGG